MRMVVIRSLLSLVCVCCGGRQADPKISRKLLLALLPPLESEGAKARVGVRACVIAWGGVGVGRGRRDRQIDSIEGLGWGGLIGPIHPLTDETTTPRTPPPLRHSKREHTTTRRCSSISSQNGMGPIQKSPLPKGGGLWWRGWRVVEGWSDGLPHPA